jgi:hypothetical protein
MIQNKAASGNAFNKQKSGLGLISTPQRRLFRLFVRSMLFAPAAKFGQLDPGLQFLVLGGIIADALAFGAFHFDEIFL